MDWIFDNIFIIAIIASAIAQWFRSNKGESDEDMTPPPGDRPGREPIDVEAMERNRQLREEIRRKRAERQAGNLQPRPTETTSTPRTSLPELPDLEREIQQQMPPVLREMMGIPEPEPPAPPPVPEVNPVLERQARMEAEMAELEAKRREAEAKAKRARRQAPAQRRRQAPAATSLDERDFLATLRDPRQARRAIVLREILSKPVGLR